MCLLLDMCEERGTEQKAKSIAKNLLNVLEITTIAEVTGLSIKEVEQLAYE